jgi:hypothetical protein
MNLEQGQVPKMPALRAVDRLGADCSQLAVEVRLVEQRAANTIFLQGGGKRLESRLILHMADNKMRV